MAQKYAVSGEEGRPKRLIKSDNIKGSVENLQIGGGVTKKVEGRGG